MWLAFVLWGVAGLVGLVGACVLCGGLVWLAGLADVAGGGLCGWWLALWVWLVWRWAGLWLVGALCGWCGW